METLSWIIVAIVVIAIIIYLLRGKIFKGEKRGPAATPPGGPAM